MEEKHFKRNYPFKHFCSVPLAWGIVLGDQTIWRKEIASKWSCENCNNIWHDETEISNYHLPAEQWEPDILCSSRGK